MPRLAPWARLGPALLLLSLAAGCLCGTPPPERTPPPAPEAQAGPDVRTCAGTPVRIGPVPQPGLRHRWAPAEGLSAAEEAQPLAAPAQTTTYTLTVTNAETGSSATDSVVVAVRALPLAQPGPAVRVCQGGEVQLGAPAVEGLRYQWQPTQGLSAEDVSAPVATPSSTTEYVLTVTDTEGCTAQAATTVTVHERPTASAGEDRVLGQGSSIQLEGAASGGTPPYTWAWSAEPACPEGTCLTSATEARPHVSPLADSVFTLSVTDALGCSASDTLGVGVGPALATEVSAAPGVCAGGSTPLEALVSGGVPPYSYAWSVAPACSGCLSGTSEPAVVATPEGPTTYTVHITDANGASVQAEALLAVSPPPGVAGADVGVDPGGQVLLGPPEVGGAAYRWTCNRPDCLLSSDSIAQPTAAPLRSTRYSLEATSGPGCTVASSTTVWVSLQATSIPADGEVSFPVSGKLEVQFDQPLAPATLNATTVALTDESTTPPTPVPAALGYQADTGILTIVPTGGSWGAGGDYALTLRGGSTGIASDDPVLPNLLANDVVVGFNTSAPDTSPPQVAFRLPDANATAVATNSPVVVVFSEPVDPATVTATTFTLSSGGAPVGATVSYDVVARTALLRPQAPLASLTLYTVTLSGVADLSGNALTTSWSFTTGSTADTQGPRVLQVDPEEGATDVLSTRAVVLVFSEVLDSRTLSGIRLVEAASGQRVSASVVQTTASRSVRLTPTAPLDSLTLYRVEVQGVVDLAGNPMPAPFTSHFTTRRTLFQDDFESGTAAWSLPATAGRAWSLVTSRSHSSNHSLTDSAQGKYANNSQNEARLAQALDVTGLTSVTLQLWLRLHTERNADFLNVEASVDDGASWTLVPGGRFSGNAGWALQTLVLPLSDATSLRLRLRMESNGSKNFDGVYVDDVLVQTP